MSAAALAIAAAFNLVCAGEQLSMTGDKSATKIEQFSITYRVDLNAARWCMDECTQTQPFHSVAPTQLIFKRVYNIGGKDDWMESFVNRESGSYSSTLAIGSIIVVRTGDCKAETFTGFPSRKF